MAARLPAFTEPQLATLVDDVPTAAGWVYEIKFDGYRTLIAASGNVVRCYSRRGLNWTSRFGAVPAAIAALGLRGALLDGEMAVLDQDGRSSFSALHEALKAGGSGITFCAFDLLYLDGEDLRGLPLEQRKRRLEKILAGAGPSITYSAHMTARGDELHRALCNQRFEGIIAKRSDKPYRSGRSTDWLKIKCTKEQEFVGAGFTRSDAKLPFASLILALQDKGGLRYAGDVGTGFTHAERRRLRDILAPMARTTPSLASTATVPSDVRRRATWTEPRFVVQVAFTEMTPDGMARHPSYRGIREDKPAREVSRETPAPVEKIAPTRRKVSKSGQRGRRVGRAQPVLGRVLITPRCPLGLP